MRARCDQLFVTVDMRRVRRRDTADCNAYGPRRRPPAGATAAATAAAAVYHSVQTHKKVIYMRR